MSVETNKDTVSGGDLFLMNVQPKRANLVWTQKEWTNLCEHLHNNNEPHSFVMGFRKDGVKQYKRSKTLLVKRAISWSWATIEGKKEPGAELAFVPYSTNSERKSRWAGLDFDAHDGDSERARSFAFAAFQYLLDTELFVILETTGSGGWHVWVVSKEFRDVGRWTRFLKQVAAAIGAPVQDGVCELYPPDTLSSGFGKGMRAPGCWNPGTETFSEIIWENTESLLSSLSLNQADFSSVGSMKKKEVSFFSSLSIYQEWEKEWSKQFAITSPSTRMEKLNSLVGTMFYQVGRDMAKRIATEQFNTKTVATNAKMHEHLDGFEGLWSGMEDQWLEGLSELEKSKRPENEHDRDAFRIIRNFHRLALKENRSDFPVGVENLGNRLGISPRGASKLRKRFVEAGIIKLTKEHVPNKTAARFKWALAGNFDQPF